MVLTTQQPRLQHLINHNWTQPSPLVGSGFDSRSSDNALLTILYGSIEHAAQYNWTNAGRTLVDKTYLHILWQAKALPTLGMSQHEIAPLVEDFVRQQLQPLWLELNQLHHAPQGQRATELASLLVTTASQCLFGSNDQESSASWLLFYLCPQLPIFPLNSSLFTATDDQIGSENCKKRLTKNSSEFPLPVASYGRKKEQLMIDKLLMESDWWQRYCLIQQLQQNH